jgi:hypothetical protein
MMRYIPCYSIVVLALALTGCLGEEKGVAESQGSATAESRVRNQTPVAIIAGATEVTSLEKILLSGSDSHDPDGGNLSFQWRQISGPSVTISQPAAREIEILAPPSLSDETIVIELRVSDGQETAVKQQRIQLIPRVRQPSQQVSFHSATTAAGLHQTLSLALTYDALPAREPLAGLGVRIFWDSRRLELTELKDLFADALMGISETMEDSDNLDGNSDTDRYRIVAWADQPNGLWPDSRHSLPLHLATAVVKPLQAGITTLELRGESAAGYQWLSQPLTLEIK